MSTNSWIFLSKTIFLSNDDPIVKVQNIKKILKNHYLNTFRFIRFGEFFPFFPIARNKTQVKLETGR
ncbi:hypothetical protein LEP1GSC043_3592 [Leptospira weilii str. Ecochallenge]|uniref:Uncharacterized protein n=1 Tax=Leptospira weilii str. Ecochallenge TaxID=1049986 RepID=N1TZX3_9LEPT|nr:hypothetical protein LEP1GSC043_3592 [Leptospira weilii str. Ecochallenge]